VVVPVIVPVIVGDEMVVVRTIGSVIVVAPALDDTSTRMYPSAFFALDELTRTIIHTPDAGSVPLKW